MHRAIQLVSSIHEAALEPSAWPDALDALARLCGAVGAAYLVRNKATDRVDWLSLAGPSAGLEPDYVEHFAALDPFRPIQEANPDGHWIWLSEALPDIARRGDPWYDDFVRRAQIGDVLGVRVLDTPSHVAVVGIHRESGAPARIELGAEALRALTDALREAARLHQELHPLGWTSALALETLDRVPGAVMVVDASGRVLQLNRAAERLLQQGDGLALRNGRLRAARSFECAKLAQLILAGAGAPQTAAAGGRMVVARGADRPFLTLSVAPLGPGLSATGRPLALVFVSDPEACAPSEQALAELFGLTPAECRLATALMRGKTLGACAACLGVQVSTLRTQLSSILEKVGVVRQTDLMRVLAGIQLAAVDAPREDARSQSGPLV